MHPYTHPLLACKNALYESYCKEIKWNSSFTKCLDKILKGLCTYDDHIIGNYPSIDYCFIWNSTSIESLHKRKWNFMHLCGNAVQYIILCKYFNSWMPIFMGQGRNTSLWILEFMVLKFSVYISMEISFSLGTKFRGFAYPQKPQKLVPHK